MCSFWQLHAIALSLSRYLHCTVCAGHYCSILRETTTSSNSCFSTRDPHHKRNRTSWLISFQFTGDFKWRSCCKSDACSHIFEINTKLHHWSNFSNSLEKRKHRSLQFILVTWMSWLIILDTQHQYSRLWKMEENGFARDASALPWINSPVMGKNGRDNFLRVEPLNSKYGCKMLQYDWRIWQV